MLITVDSLYVKGLIEETFIASYDQHHLALSEVRRLCLERRREWEHLKRIRWSIALLQSSTGDATQTGRPEVQEGS